jgi:hypothetical protein
MSVFAHPFPAFMLRYLTLPFFSPARHGEPPFSLSIAFRIPLIALLFNTYPSYRYTQGALLI